ncbi:MAG: Rne/Rng family ribonuclease [Acidimicrobiales bacterium]|nr:Rne/Rng family ribonuclease [Acidimicrobiales bacterium]
MSDQDNASNQARNDNRARGDNGSSRSRQGRSGSGQDNKPQDNKRTAPPAARKPQIGGSRPAPVAAPAGDGGDDSEKKSGSGRRRRRGGRGRGRGGSGGGQTDQGQNQGQQRGQKQAKDQKQNQGKQNDKSRSKGKGGGQDAKQGGQGGRRKSGGGRGRDKQADPVRAVISDEPIELDEKTLASRRGRARKGQPVGRYQMCVSRRDDATQIAILEGRSLMEHYVSRPSDDISQIHGNIYMGRVQNVLPGMEAAFVDISTPKNAVLYRGDVVHEKAKDKHNRPRIEQMLKNKQMILSQVTKNPIAHKGARLTMEVSLPGRFVVLVPNSSTYGISKRLPDSERKRLRQILDRAKPKQHGVIVRTAAEDVTAEEIEADVRRLLQQWDDIEKLVKSTKKPQLLYREPDLSLRIIREEFNKDYRKVIIDDRELYEDVLDYVTTITPALAERIEFFDRKAEKLSLFEKHHVTEQLRRAVDSKVWLPGGGSLIIEHTEALTVIDVNTGKNVGSKSLEETVYRNNLEAAVEVARQLRLRDIGGIIVIDFVDMEVKKNREEVIAAFREALARDKTRTQVYDISELGLVEMTRKRIGEGLLESMSHQCETCDGHGHLLDQTLLDI